jgi:hypothetical protein
MDMNLNASIVLRNLSAGGPGSGRHASGAMHESLLKHGFKLKGPHKGYDIYQHKDGNSRIQVSHGTDGAGNHSWDRVDKKFSEDDDPSQLDNGYDHDSLKEHLNDNFS